MSTPTPQSVTGTIDFKVGNETFQTWYRLYGDLKSPRRPLIVLHGGPGIPCYYLDTFSDLTAQHGIPVLIYDQVGCGNSTHLKDKDASFWTEELFMNELENVINHFGIADDFDIGGHSWGSMLGARFASTRQPKGLKHLILGNSLARVSDWIESNKQLLKKLPEKTQEIIMHHETEGVAETPEYQEALGQFFDRFVCQIKPHPDSVAESEKGLAADNTVNKIMWGPTWLIGRGALKDWTIVEDLPKINVPTLVYHGKHDQSQDFVVAPLFKHLRRVKLVRFENSSHMSHHEVRDEVMKLVGDFIINC